MLQQRLLDDDDDGEIETQVNKSLKRQSDLQTQIDNLNRKIKYTEIALSNAQSDSKNLVAEELEFRKSIYPRYLLIFNYMIMSEAALGFFKQDVSQYIIKIAIIKRAIEQHASAIGRLFKSSESANDGAQDSINDALTYHFMMVADLKSLIERIESYQKNFNENMAAVLDNYNSEFARLEALNSQLPLLEEEIDKVNKKIENLKKVMIKEEELPLLSYSPPHR